jgi:hypothetical protein
MYDQQIYEARVQNMTALALESNANEAVFWRNRRDSWLADAAIKKANKQEFLPKPYPPARKATVVAPPWRPGAEQSEIHLVLGPEFVDDPACDLPPDPVPGPPGTVEVGGLSWAGPPAIYACGEQDTAAPGTLAEKDGRKLVKVRIPSPFGRGFSQWYQEKVA